ncbi:hypothetical protein KY285_024567 [Solanum tuberosum]|nr:hypothetical protein KY289_024804 [Solanum tuberosum]KAH0676766.1 hypothetical protein KY285_024567 [Solanum tuberosum]
MSQERGEGWNPTANSPAANFKLVGPYLFHLSSPEENPLPASCSRGGGVLERTTHCCVAPTQGRAFGEEHCFEGEKAWLTNQSSEATGVRSSSRSVSGRN